MKSCWVPRSPATEKWVFRDGFRFMRTFPILVKVASNTGRLLLERAISLAVATSFQVITTVAGAVTNVVLNLILIPAYSGFGAAIATTLSYGVAAVFSCFLHRQTWPVGTIMLKSLVAPFRLSETTRTFNLIRSVVDREPPVSVF